jgi:hypothetical protein
MQSKSGITATVPCRHCDMQISAIAEICPACGVRQFPAELQTQGTPSERTVVPAALLCLMLGVFGAHRFYVGRTGTAFAQLFTLGGLGLWMLFDLILILTGQFRDEDGRRVTEVI